MKTLLFAFLALIMAGCVAMPAQPAPSTPLPVTATPTASPSPVATGSPAPDTCQVTTGVPDGTLNIRAGAGVQNGVLAVLTEGDILTRTGQQDGRWWQVVTRKNLTGWINSDFCK